MATIPTVALSAVPTAPNLGPRADVGAFTAVSRAVVGAGAAVADVGAQLGRFAAMKQEQVNRGILAQEETVRMETAAQIQAEMYSGKNPPATWGALREGAWASYEKGRAQRMKEEGWGREVVEVDNQAYQTQRARWGIQFGTEQAKAEIEQSNVRLEVAMNQHIATGNVDAAYAAIDAMDATPGAKDAKRAEVLPKLQYQAAIVHLTADPFAAYDNLQDGDNFTGISPAQRLNLLQQAKNLMATERAEVANSIQERRLAGEVIDEEELKGFVASRRLNATTAKAIVAEQKRVAGGGDLTVTSRTEAAKLLVEINAYDPVADTSKEKLVELRERISGLHKALIESARSQLTEKGSKSSPLNSPAAKAAFKQIETAFEMEVYGNYMEKAVDLEGKMKAKPHPGRYMAALENRAKVEDEMTRFFKANPEATMVQAVGEVNRLNAVALVKAGAPMFRTERKAETVPTSEELDTILKNAGYGSKK